MSVYIDDHFPEVKTFGFNTAKTTSKFGDVMVPIYETIQLGQVGQAASTWAVSQPIFLNDSVSGTYQISGVSVNFGTASTSGTLQVEVATGIQAIAAGTNQLTGTLSLSGTAYTTVNGTVIASPTVISAGARVNLIFAGTVTNLANAIVTIVLQRLS
jgi:hypothetical protein